MLPGLRHRKAMSQDSPTSVSSKSPSSLSPSSLQAPPLESLIQQCGRAQHGVLNLLGILIWVARAQAQ